MSTMTNTSCIRCRHMLRPDNQRYEGFSCTNPIVMARYNEDTGRTVSEMYIDQARPMFCQGRLFEEKALAGAKPAVAPAQQVGHEPVAWRVTGAGGITVTPEYPKWAEADSRLLIESLYTAPQPAPAQDAAGPAPQPDVSVLDGKYGDVLRPFVSMMEAELHANSGKGDRQAWLQMDGNTALLEIYYHAGKLQKAVKQGNGDHIGEYAADIANLAMMLADLCGALDLRSNQPAQWRVELERDAARYRTFRDVPDDLLGAPGVPCVALPESPKAGKYISGDDLDAALSREVQKQ